MKLALLLSGGVDSIAVAYWKRPSIAITLDYGQIPAEAEIQAAAAVCGGLGVTHEILRINCSAIGSGDLRGTKPLPLAPVSEWWPFRNQLLITLAAPLALAHNCDTLVVGAVSSDRAHADGTPEFFEQLSKTMELQEGNVRIDTPAIGLSSAELVRASRVPIEVLAWAHSCHTSNLACGFCRGCAKHFETMKELGVGPY